MKKFKLFAVAVFAMLSTNAFAKVGDVDANTVFRFEITKDYVASPEALGTATILGFVADYTAVATTTIPATINGATYGGKYKVTAIAKDAFKGKAITKIDLSAAENLTEIGAGAFSGTSITSLDLSATKVAVLNQLFETTNKKVKSVKLPKTLTTIGENAFNGLSALNKITFAAQSGTDKYSLTIGANAFKNTMALTTLTLPANVSYIAANAFAKTYLTTLTISGDIPAYADATSYASAKEYNEAKKTDLDDEAFGKLSAEEKIKTPATGVATGAFVKNGSQALTVNYTPSTAGENRASFKQDAFAASGANVWVTFVTTTHYGETTLAEEVGVFEADAKGNVLYGAKLDFTPTGLATIPVYNQGGTSYSYGTFYDKANDITIAKKQGDANVMVYGAYVDNAKTPAVLMEQMHLIGGLYYIPKNTPIIVKTSGTAAVEYVKGADLKGNDSQNYKKSTEVKDGDPVNVLQNEIKVYEGEDDYAVNVVVPEKTYAIFLKPLAETAFGWAEFADNRVIKKGQFYLVANDPAAASRLIWLDGSEEDQVTAIQNVKTAAKNNGAIFNLAGQKVNAAYKGVVIKDGKKYIQK